MKKISYSIFALALLTMVSCKKDDDQIPVTEPLPNTVSYNGKNFSIDNGTIIDWGAWENHYNHDFILTDGEMDFENDKAIGATVMIYAELWSPGSENFSTGTFTFNNSENTDGKRYFDNVVVVTDTDNNGELDDSDDQLSANAGTVKVSGSGTNYTVEVDLTLSNNKSVKGSYSGTFQIMEGTLEEMSAQRNWTGKPVKHTFK